MAVTVKKAALWRKEVENHPGILANILGPLSDAGTNLQVVMAYRYPGRTDTAAIELHPVSGRKPIAVAKAAGLAQSPIPILTPITGFYAGSARRGEKEAVGLMGSS